jgi:hypothetical protein
MIASIRNLRVILRGMVPLKFNLNKRFDFARHFARHGAAQIL